MFVPYFVGMGSSNWESFAVGSVPLNRSPEDLQEVGTKSYEISSRRKHGH
jgi:hypothetical protein